MSHSFDELLQAYERQVGARWSPGLSPAERVWILWYDKALERRSTAQIGLFENATVAASHGWRLLDLSPTFGRWIAAHRHFGALLRRPNEIQSVLPEFERHLIGHVVSLAADMTVNDVLMLTGAASLFGLSSVSRLIEGIAPSLRGRLVVAFPGHYEVGRYRLLDARDGWNYHAIPIPSSNL